MAETASVISAQLCSSPTEMADACVRTSAAGGDNRLLVVPLPSSPDALTPQHRTPPEIVRAQVKKYPAATAWASARTSVATVALFGRRFRSGREARVAVVQTTDFWDLDDLAHTGRVDSSRIRRVLAQGQMGSRPVVVGEIRFQDSAKIPLAEDDDVVESRTSRLTAGRPG